MLDKLSNDDFTKYLNSLFSLTLDSGENVELKLVDVTELKNYDNNDGDNQGRKPFSIMFSGPQQPVLPQGIHTLNNYEMQPLSIFMVPIGPDNNGMRYEAVFN